MKRFRITLLVVSLLLLWLGYTNLQVHFRNKTPQEISIQELEKSGPPREWLEVIGGYQNILEAINMSGTMEIDALLVPLNSSPASKMTTVWFETRDPEIIEIWKTYFFKLDTAQQQSRFAEENIAEIYAQRNLIGMTADSNVASNNKAQLEELLTKLNVPYPANTIFLSEEKVPDSKNGYIFIGIAFLGLIRLIFNFRTKQKGRSN